MPYHKPAHRPRGFLGARVIDMLAAMLAIAVLAPVLAVRALAGRVTAGRWVVTTPALGLDCQMVTLLEFAGRLPGGGLAQVVNLLRGDLALAGPRPARIGERGHWLSVAPERFAVRPGLVGANAPRELMGIAFDCEAEADRDFATCHRASSPTTLLLRWMLVRCLAGPTAARIPGLLEILGVRIHNTTRAEAVAWLTSRARQGSRTLVAFANPDCINTAQLNVAYRRVLQRADRVFADGSGTRIASRLLGQKMAENVNGTDLFPELCRAAARDGLKLFLLGARPGLAEATAEAMRQRHPGLEVVGTMHGYFDAAETRDVIDGINRSGADILLVAMGAPQQELWLSRHAAALAPPVRLGVGGLFDYYSGRIQRAPVWMREAGIEWVWRLACEPVRLWKRYLVGNPVFLARVLHERVFGRRNQTAIAIQADSRLARAVAAMQTRVRMLMPAVRDRVLADGKRTLDVVVSVAAILILSPMLALTALAIRLDSPGPVIFRQQRVGRGGQPFTMLKFRSMYEDAEARKAALLAHNEMSGGVIFKMQHDPRVTGIGRFIRRTSIDELPQLFNVLRGDMSLVGPRPPLPSEVALYTLMDRGRLDVAPGITCIWQVSGRSEVSFPQQVEMDLDYIHRQSLSEDVRLLLRTVPALVRGRGAY